MKTEYCTIITVTDTFLMTLPVIHINQ